MPAVGAFATFSVLRFHSALLPSVLTEAFHDENHALAGAVSAALFFAATLAAVCTPAANAKKAMIAGLALLLPGIALLVLAQALRSLLLLWLGTCIAGLGGGLGYRFGLQLVNEATPEGRRSEVVSTYLIVCYAAISLPVVGIGVVASLSSLMLADVLFGALVAVFALSALVFGIAGQPLEKA